MHLLHVDDVQRAADARQSRVLVDHREQEGPEERRPSLRLVAATSHRVPLPQTSSSVASVLLHHAANCCTSPSQPRRSISSTRQGLCWPHRVSHLGAASFHAPPKLRSTAQDVCLKAITPAAWILHTFHYTVFSFPIPISTARHPPSAGQDAASLHDTRAAARAAPLDCLCSGTQDRSHPTCRLYEEDAKWRHAIHDV